MTNDEFDTGKFYASEEDKVVGPLVDQSTFFTPLNNPAYQDNAHEALHRFIQ